MSTFFRGMWTGITENLEPVREALGRLREALSPVGGAMRSAFGWLADLLPDLTVEGESFGEAMVRALVAAIDAVTALVSFLRELFSLSFYDAGAKLMGTFVDGIKATAGYRQGCGPGRRFPESATFCRSPTRGRGRCPASHTRAAPS